MRSGDMARSSRGRLSIGNLQGHTSCVLHCVPSRSTSRPTAWFNIITSVTVVTHFGAAPVGVHRCWIPGLASVPCYARTHARTHACTHTYTNLLVYIWMHTSTCTTTQTQSCECVWERECVYMCVSACVRVGVWGCVCEGVWEIKCAFGAVCVCVRVCAGECSST